MALQGARQEIPGLDRGKPATSTIDWFDEGKRLFTVAAPAWIIFSALYSHEYWRRFEITPYLFGSLAELLPGSVFFAAITIGSVALIWLIDVVILGRKEMDAIDGATERVVLAFFFVSLIFPVVVSSAAIDLSDAVKMSVYAGGMAVTRYAMRFNALIRIFPHILISINCSRGSSSFSNARGSCGRFRSAGNNPWKKVSVCSRNILARRDACV